MSFLLEADRYFGHGAFYFLSLEFDVDADITLFRPHRHWSYSVLVFFVCSQQKQLTGTEGAK